MEVLLGPVLAALGLFGAIDWTTLTDPLTTGFEGAVTQVLPVVAVIILAGLIFRTIRKYLRA